jgi:ribosomal protein L37AE/L43A
MASSCRRRSADGIGLGARLGRRARHRAQPLHDRVGAPAASDSTFCTVCTTRTCSSISPAISRWRCSICATVAAIRSFATRLASASARIRSILDLI